ncbi:hypothetical protein ACJEQ9_42195, partial [Klebsiella pneumoniae]
EVASGDLPLFVSASEKRRAAKIPPLRSNEDLYRYFSERWECAAPSTGVSSANPALPGWNKGATTAGDL